MTDSMDAKLRCVGLVKEVIVKQLVFLVLTLLIAAPAISQQVCEEYILNETPNDRYEIHGDGTVTDKETGLMWQQCSIGLSGNDCASGSLNQFTWKTALEEATLSNLGGYSDWRLPDLKELKSLVAYDCYGPSINSTAFPNTFNGNYWTSSPYADDENISWRIHFYVGWNISSTRDNPYFVRLVR